MARRQATRRNDAIGAGPLRRALAARVSTEDQAERGTIQGQIDFLRSRTDLDNKAREMQGLPPIVVVGEYLDDGVSGAVPIADRPDGKRLIADADDGLMDQVMWYRLDRMGRSLTVLSDAHDRFERAGVAVVSATEPFDTSTPFGKAMFQFLGLIAELEKSTIADRFNNGRDRAVRNGKWSNGVIPFGFSTDGEGYLIPSERVVAGTGMTEAEVARGIFERMADGEGETLGSICRWLNGLGVPTESRYPNGRVWATQASEWRPNRVHAMLGRPIYGGTRVFDSRLGQVEGAAPALVSREVQERAVARLRGNAARPSHGGRLNLLRGLLICGECGTTYVGHSMKLRSGKVVPYYRCGGQANKFAMESARRCRSKLLPADEVEGLVKEYVRRIAADPGAELAEAQAATREQSQRATHLEEQTAALGERLRELGAERERMLALYRRGRVSLDEVDVQLDETARAEGATRAELESIRMQRALAEASEARLVTAAAAMALVAQEFDRVPPERQQAIIAALVTRIQVQTVELPSNGKRRVKDYRLVARTVVGHEETAVESTAGRCSAAASRASRRRWSGCG